MANLTNLSHMQISSLYQILFNFFQNIKPLSKPKTLKVIPFKSNIKNPSISIYLILKIIFDNVLLNAIKNDNFAKLLREQLYILM